MIKWPRNQMTLVNMWRCRGMTRWRSPMLWPTSSRMNSQSSFPTGDRFLQQKAAGSAAGFELDALKKRAYSLLFCLPVLELGIEWLMASSEVLIYPRRLLLMTSEDSIGLVHNQRVVQSGKAGSKGPHHPQLAGYSGLVRRVRV